MYIGYIVLDDLFYFKQGYDLHFTCLFHLTSLRSHADDTPVTLSTHYFYWLKTLRNKLWHLVYLQLFISELTVEYPNKASSNFAIVIHDLLS